MKLTTCSEFWTSVLAVVHLAMAPAFYGDSVRSILDAGVLRAVDSGRATWSGSSSRIRDGHGGDRRVRVLLVPVSGFWLFFSIAWLAWRNTAPAHMRERAS